MTQGFKFRLALNFGSPLKSPHPIKDAISTIYSIGFSPANPTGFFRKASLTRRAGARLLAVVLSLGGFSAYRHFGKVSEQAAKAVVLKTCADCRAKEMSEET